MGLKSDRWITNQVRLNRMIEPFFHEKVRRTRANDQVPAISYGLSSYGYDITLASEIKVFVPKPGRVIDPKHFPVEVMEDLEVTHSLTDGSYVDMPPHSFALCHTVEYFRIPLNVLSLVIGKSTYARSSLILNCTPLEPGWHGFITLEITNTNPLPARLYINEGIGQVLFFEGDEPPMNGYGNGKYQNQDGGIQTPIV